MPFQWLFRYAYSFLRLSWGLPELVGWHPNTEASHQRGRCEFKAILSLFVCDFTWEGLVTTYGWSWVAPGNFPLSALYIPTARIVRETLIKYVNKSLVWWHLNYGRTTWRLKLEQRRKCESWQMGLSKGWKDPWNTSQSYLVRPGISKTFSPHPFSQMRTAPQSWLPHCCRTSQHLQTSSSPG